MASSVFEADIGAVAALIGDPTRARMLQALTDADHALSVTDLARTARVTRRDRIVEVTEAGRSGFIRWLGVHSRVTAQLGEG